jgi:hypothetical protein
MAAGTDTALDRRRADQVYFDPLPLCMAPRQTSTQLPRIVLCRQPEPPLEMDRSPISNFAYWATSKSCQTAGG